MSEEKPAKREYTMGYDNEFHKVLKSRRAEIHAAHLLPLLKPGFKLLDFGCGPGSITTGLSERVAPGEAHGIDSEESQIAQARAAAAEGGHCNATFHVGDVTDLPFEDNSFDVAHCHALLMHEPDTKATLAEVKRVLKPGGIISSREMIVASSFLEPDFGLLQDVWTTFSSLLAANGGHPQMGKELKYAFAQAGFTGIRATASIECFSTPDEIEHLGAFNRDWFFSENVITSAANLGISTRRQFEEWRGAHERWEKHNGAMGAWAFGEAIALKPAP